MPKTSIALACTLLLAACAHGPDFERPAAPTATAYTDQAVKVDGLAPGENLPPDWWQMFHSPAITDVVNRALAGNRTLAVASAHLAAAQEAVTARRGAIGPQVGLQAGTGREKYGAAFLGTAAKPPIFTYYQVGPTVSYSVDYTGGAARSVEQQRALAEVRQRQLDAAGLAVSGQAVTEALKIASLKAQIATVEQLLERDRENLKLVHLAFDAGSVSRLDIVSAESQLASDTTLLPPLRQDLSTARHALALVLGTTPSEAKLPEFDLAQVTLPAKLPVSVPSELARHRPDILSAEAQLHAATAAVGVAEGNLYPHIDLAANFGQQAVTIGGLFEHGAGAFGITGTLLAPLFDGGRLRAEKRAAVDDLQASAAQYQQTVLEAFGQVADSLQALSHGDEQLQAQAHAQDAARDNVDLTRQSYHEGNVGVLQVLDAERRYQQARLGYVRADAQRYIDTVQLFLALGGGVPMNAPVAGL